MKVLAQYVVGCWSTLSTVEQQLQVSSRKPFGGLSSLNVSSKPAEIAMANVCLQKPLALGSKQFLVFGRLLALAFQLHPALLQGFHLLMEQCLRETMRMSQSCLLFRGC